MGNPVRHPRRRGPDREGDRGPRRRQGHQPDPSRGPGRRRHPHGPRPLPVRGVCRQGRAAGDDDAEIAQHHPAARDAAGGVHLRGGTPAGGGVRRQGHRRDRAGADRISGSRGPLRVRRCPPQPVADEGLSRSPCRRTQTGSIMIPNGGRGGSPAGTVALVGGTVAVALDPPELARADLVIAGGRIAAVGTAPQGTARRDCSGTLIIPGNVCAHHHLYSALARGMPYELEPPANFLQILQRVWWRLDRALDEPAIRLSALRGGLDALLAGTTTIVDHHASPNAIDGSLDIIAAALEELGLRSILCYEVTDRDGPGRAAAGIAENLRFLRTTWPLARRMMGAHASFTLSDETLAAIVAGTEGAGVGIHIHVAEDAADERDALARSGTRVVQRVDAAGALDGA